MQKRTYDFYNSYAQSSSLSLVPSHLARHACLSEKSKAESKITTVDRGLAADEDISI
jgi:hypothetical protein